MEQIQQQLERWLSDCEAARDACDAYDDACAAVRKAKADKMYAGKGWADAPRTIEDADAAIAAAEAHQAEMLQQRGDAEKKEIAWRHAWDKGHRLREAHMRHCAAQIERGETRFVVITSSAKMPNTCWGRYSHVAVLEVAEDAFWGLHAIDDRARSVKRIVQGWYRLFHGETDRCAFAQALEEAHAVADERNDARRAA